MARKKAKRNRRIFVFGFFCVAICGVIFYSVIGIWRDILNKNYEKEQLISQLADLEEQESNLKTEVDKLKDPEYLAKYAREKYLYSSKGEYIINIK